MFSRDCAVCLAQYHRLCNALALKSIPFLRFVRLISHVSVAGLDTTLPGKHAAMKNSNTLIFYSYDFSPGTRSACVSDHIPYAHVTSHSALYGANAVYSECAVMWALHRAYGVANVGLLPIWANWEVARPPMD
jgi:hypothetical protein